MKTDINRIPVLEDFEREIEKFLKQSYDEFVSSGYKNMVEESKKKQKETPFLSIIVRTQGKREEALREVFLCLEGQSNQNFEVLLIGHKLNKEQNKLVQTIVSEQGDELKKKIRFIPLDRGNRTTPLNVGFANAWGDYIIVLDDDDIVFDNWVHNFYEAHKKHNGKVFYGYVLSQKWSVLEKGEYKGGLRAESAFDMNFSRAYSELYQIEMNRCPQIGLAYPAYAFQELGIIFDENLATTEDWDFLLRVAYICGVYSVKEPCCVYRKWENTENSFTLHSEEEWNKNYKTIVNKSKARTLCLPKGGAEEVFQLIKDRNWLLKGEVSKIKNVHAFDFERMYIEKNDGFSEEHVMKAQNKYFDDYGHFTLEYHVDKKDRSSRSFRWDFIESGVLLIRNLYIEVVYENGDKKSALHIEHTGYSIENALLFAQDDPHIKFMTDKKTNPMYIVITGEVSTQIPYQMIQALLQVPYQVVQLCLQRPVNRLNIWKRIKNRILG